MAKGHVPTHRGNTDDCAACAERIAQILAERHRLSRMGDPMVAAYRKASQEHYMVIESMASINEFRRSTGQRPL